MDYWNFILDMKDYSASYRLDFEKLPSVLTHNSTITPGEARYDETRVYASINRAKESERGLLRFLEDTVQTIPGYTVHVTKRKSKKGVHCPQCDSMIEYCPNCNSDLIKTVEKGVDTWIVTDMLQMAWDDVYDIGILLSSDRDYIPAVEFLHKREKKVIHASFSGVTCELAKKCWMHIDLRRFASELKRTDSPSS